MAVFAFCDLDGLCRVQRGGRDACDCEARAG